MIGFVGKSGARKTTIFNLLCKMYDVQDGEILIEDKNIKELDEDSIRGNITIISQNPYIFNLSIRDNLKLVKENLTDEEMHEACKLACLDEFIENLPDKYDTIVGEAGVVLSGGQKQRLAIARALIQTFYTYANWNFKYDVSKTLYEQHVSKISKTIIANLFKEYWATLYQKGRIKAKEDYDIRQGFQTHK